MSKKLCQLVLALGLLGCGAEASKAPEQPTLTGTVHTLQTVKDGESRPVAGAKVVAPDGKKAVTDEKGGFSVAFDKKGTGPIKVESDKAAPVQKPAPKQVQDKSSLRADLHVKSFDAVASFDPRQGGSVEHEGSRLELVGDQLEASSGEVGAKAQLMLAAITPSAPGDAAAITGNYDAKKGEGIGKVSITKVVYVAARKEQTGKETDALKLQKDKKATLTIRNANQKQKTRARSLYWFDEAADQWLELESLDSEQGGDGSDVVREVDRLGWFAVGDFYPDLTCIEACVVGGGQPAGNARVVANGVDHFAEYSTFTDAAGCFKLELPQWVTVQVQAGTESGQSALRQVEVGAGGAAGSCQSLPAFEVQATAAQCESGFSDCSGVCVDVAQSREHCGGCGKPCAAVCRAGQCMNVDSPFDAGMSGTDDASLMEPDASPGQPDAFVGACDEVGYVTDTSCGIGYCQQHNTPSSCSGGVETPCMPRTPASALDSTANLIDDDCDGQVDEEVCNGQTTTYPTPGTYIAPASWCSTVTVTLWGGGGASGEKGGSWGTVNPAPGGAGGYARAVLPITHSSQLRIDVGQGGQGCGNAAGVNPNAAYSGGTGGASQGANGGPGADGTQAGGTGGTSTSAGDGGRGWFGGGGGGAGAQPVGGGFGRGGGGGAASAVTLDAIVVVAGGGGGGGGAGSDVTAAGTEGTNGGSGCGTSALNSPNAYSAAGGGGGVCWATGTTFSLQAGVTRTPPDPSGNLPAGSALGGNSTGDCLPGGNGYVIVTFGP